MSELRTKTRSQGVKKRGAAHRCEGNVWLSPGEGRFEMVRSSLANADTASFMLLLRTLFRPIMLLMWVMGGKLNLR
jgi:hypothetical protein